MTSTNPINSSISIFRRKKKSPIDGCVCASNPTVDGMTIAFAYECTCLETLTRCVYELGRQPIWTTSWSLDSSSMQKSTVIATGTRMGNMIFCSHRSLAFRYAKLITLHRTRTEMMRGHTKCTRHTRARTHTPPSIAMGRSCGARGGGSEHFFVG